MTSADEQSGRTDYVGTGTVVTFEPSRCVRANACVQALPSVFDRARRPWIVPDAASPRSVEATVRACPSGALRYWPADGCGELPHRPTSITCVPGGQLMLRGDLLFTDSGDTRRETRAALCGCGLSARKPYCDLSGECGKETRTGRAAE